MDWSADRFNEVNFSSYVVAILPLTTPLLRYLLAVVFVVCLLWVLIVLIRFRPVFQRRCPNCKAERGLVREARPAFIKTFFSFLPIKAYHCRSCMQNFLLIKSDKSDGATA
jgi:hypothetical protein